MNKKIIALVVGVLIILGVVYAFTAHTTQRFGGTTNLDQLTLGSGLTVTSGGILSTGNSSTTGLGYFSQGIIEGGVDSIATTSNAYTLGLSDVLGVSMISFAGSSTGATTVTLPSTTTLATFLPNIGDTTLIVVSNATSTGSKLTLASNGSTVVFSASTTKDINIGRSAILRLSRLASSSIEVFMIQD